MPTMLPLLCTLLFVSVLSQEQCSFEFLDQNDLGAYVDFGDPNCVFGLNVPKSIEIWIKPLQDGQTFSEGIVFESGLFEIVKGDSTVFTSFTLSLKASGQLFGVLWEKENGKESMETISASADNAVKMNEWTHVVWMPFSNHYYFNAERSTKATINGNTLNGINNFSPSESIKIGSSFHGRISLLRLWDFEISQVENHMNELLTCDLKESLVAYYDFSYCKQEDISDFSGRACGKVQPSETHFLWYNLDAPASLSENRYHSRCDLERTCSEDCQRPNPISFDTLNTKVEKEDKNNKEPLNLSIIYGIKNLFSGSGDVSGSYKVNIIIAVAASVILLVSFLTCFFTKTKKMPYNPVVMSDL